MNTPIIELENAVREAFPCARVHRDPPVRDGGFDSLDLRNGDRHVFVEWRPQLGFGISLLTGEEAFDDGADRVATGLAEAAEVVFFLLHRVRALPKDNSDPGAPPFVRDAA